MPSMNGSAGDGKIYPLEWIDRADGMPDIPGTPSVLCENLRALLIAIGPGVDAAAEIRWPANELTRVSSAARRATRSGLLVRASGRIVPTAEGAAWRDGGDEAMLTEILHRNVRFIGELMALLVEKSQSHKELLELACTRYGFRWETEAPIRNRTSWLRATGMVDLFNGRVHLMEPGRRILERLVLGAPHHTEESASIESLSGFIVKALQLVRDDQLKERNRRTQLYIPGRESGEGRLDNLRTLVEACTHSISASRFAQVCANVTGNPTFKSDATVRDGLQAMGLIERRGKDEWVTTPGADAWIESNNQGDLAALLHMNLWYFAEILREMNRAGEVTVADLAAEAVSCDPSGEGIAKSRIRERLQMLMTCGYVSRVTWKSYRTTPEGRAFLDFIPRLSAPGELPQVTGVMDKSSIQVAEEEMQDEAQEIAMELEEAAVDGRRSERLEHVVVAALRFLGFEAEHIGGNGEPDGIVHTELGQYGSKLLIEAKAASNGIVSEAHAAYLTLERHRKRHGVATTFLVGPNFEQVVLDRVNQDGNVAVMLTNHLARAVRKHASFPLIPQQMSALFAPDLRHDERIQELEELWSVEAMRSIIIDKMIDVFREEVYEPVDGHAEFNVIAIRRSLWQRHDLRVEDEEILDALDFLASPRIQAIVEVATDTHRKNNSSEERRKRAYRMAAPRETIHRRIATIARHI